jgi:hypothetical protein
MTLKSVAPPGHSLGPATAKPTRRSPSNKPTITDPAFSI